MISRHIIFLNGPPRSGKDEVGRILQAHSPSVQCFKAADPIKQAIHSFLDISEHTGEEFKSAALRDVPGVDLDSDLTLRELYIEFSESFVKPLLGEATFGHMLGQRIQVHRPPVAVVTDSGFLPEVAACLEWARTVGYVPHVWQLHRKGCTFDGDSRSYLGLADLIPLGITSFAHIENNGTLDDLCRSVIGYYKAIGDNDT